VLNPSLVRHHNIKNAYLLALSPDKKRKAKIIGQKGVSTSILKKIDGRRKNN
jgi:hypothetical protein